MNSLLVYSTIYSPIEIPRNNLGIKFDSEHGEKFWRKSMFNYKCRIQLNKATNNDFIFSQKEIRIFVKDKFQDLVVVNSWVMFFRDFEIIFFIFSIETFIIHLKWLTKII